MNTDFYTSPSIISEKVLFKTSFQAAQQNGLPVVFWRNPKEKYKEGIVALTQDVPLVKADMEESPSGFFIGNFESKEREALFVPADIYLSSASLDIKVLSPKADTRQKDAFFTAVADSQTMQTKVSKSIYHTSVKRPNCMEQQAFEAMVQSGIEGIQSDIFKKVVLSRTKQVELSDDFNIVDTFFELCEAYPTAFVSLISVPKLGTWMGASPETLVRVDGNEYFKTVALAGTQAKGNQHPSEARWAQKEIEEQALVSRYIINCFKKIRLREFEERGPRTVAAGHLLHLLTEFKVNMKDTSFPQLGSVMLELLHPTSAVCGMPKQESQAFILAEEKYDRSIYSGFIGPVNINNSSELFVNLRCMQLFEKTAVLYAGAGITEDSIPEKEWVETELKMDIMKNFLI